MRSMPAGVHGLSLVIALFVVLGFAGSANAQLTRGSISGTVTDSSGSVIPGARVQIKNLVTNQTRTVTTNDDGLYRATALEPGRYSVAISKEGHETVEDPEVVVETSRESTVDAQLQVGSISATVNVTSDAQAVALNKTDATVSLTLTGRQATELPLNIVRNAVSLALLSPNVQPSNIRIPPQITANGQRFENNNFQIDGSDNNDLGNSTDALTVVPETVAEFQIKTTAYSAENGRNTGAQINFITKSGTNSFHSEGWWYYRGNSLDALTNAQKRNGLTSVPRFARQQYGFDLGGPIVKDRTFFFGSFQRDTIRRPQSFGGVVDIPTPTGFAALGTVPLRSGQSAASRAGVLSSLGFLNSIYPQNPVFFNVRNVCLNPTSAGAGCPGGRLVEYGFTQVARNAPTNITNILIRGDHRIGESDSMTVRYLTNNLLNANATSNVNFGELFAADVKTVDHNLAASETHVFNSQVVNEIRFSYIRRTPNFPETDPLTPTTNVGAPLQFSFGGAQGFPQDRIQNSFQFSDTVTWQHGRHGFKFGADIRYNRVEQVLGFNSKGTFVFNSFQDYLNNVAASYSQIHQTPSFLAKETQQYYFFQDDFKITPELTLNLGLRYELSSVPFGFFGAVDPDSLAALVPGPVSQDKNNWAPRFGFAYSPRATHGLSGAIFGDGTTVIRGGYGISYDHIFSALLFGPASNFPRVLSTTQFNATDVYPTVPRITGAPAFSALSNYTNFEQTAKTPYSQSWSLTVQRAIQPGMVVEVGYTGSHSLNQINYSEANPVTLTLANRLLTPQNRRLFPQFGSRARTLTEAQASYNSGFVSLIKRMARGLQFNASYTFSKNITSEVEDSINSTGIGFVAQNVFNRTLEKGLSGLDRTHRFVANFIYEVPWFKGEWAKQPLVSYIFKGWRISGIVQRTSGTPFSIYNGPDANGDTNLNDRAGFNPGGTLTLDPVTGNLRSFTNNGRFVLVGANTVFGGATNLGKNTLRGPGFYNTDLSLAKKFPLWWEGHAFTVRADFFNAFNQDSYGNPVSTVASPNFGRNLNSWGNRSIMLSGKYSF